jgi:nucleoid-associated protein YgaU
MGLFGHHDDDQEREAVQRHREAQQRLADARRHRELREQAETTGPAARPERSTYPEGSWKKEFELYVVKKGDTLWGIARQSYGDGAHWTRIQQANPVVLKDPDVIHAGLVLRIPRGEAAPLA